MKKILWYVTDFFASMRKHHIEMYSAASAYYIFICIIPFLTILIYLIPYTFIDKDMVINIVESLFPSNTYTFSFNLIDEVYTRVSALLPISIVIMFWTASKTVVSIRNGLNDINEIIEKKNFLIVRLIATLYTVIAMLLILFICFLSLFGTRVHELLARYDLKVLNFLNVLIDYKVLITLIGFFIVFLILYAFLPAKNNKLKNVIPGSIFSSIACFLFLKIFDFLINNYLTFSMYGSLATIVILLVYLNFIFYFFFLGAYLNKYLLKGNDNEI